MHASLVNSSPRVTLFYLSLVPSLSLHDSSVGRVLVQLFMNKSSLVHPIIVHRVSSAMLEPANHFVTGYIYTHLSLTRQKHILISNQRTGLQVIDMNFFFFLYKLLHNS